MCSAEWKTDERAGIELLSGRIKSVHGSELTSLPDKLDGERRELHSPFNAPFPRVMQITHRP